MCNRSSFEQLQNIWISDLKQNLKDAHIVLVANKSDKSSERQVTEEEGRDLAIKHKLKQFMEVSALDGNGIKKLVHLLAYELLI